MGGMVVVGGQQGELTGKDKPLDFDVSASGT